MSDAANKLEIDKLKKEITRLRSKLAFGDATSIQLTAQRKKFQEISKKLSRYLSPQIHKQIFSGKESAEVKSSRKKLTILFSDIVDFTAISDQLESEELTNILNFYLNEMSEIAFKFGGTVDKYIGDGIMIFFGDPESAGAEQDAKVCVQMAIEMQKRVGELKDYWGKQFGLANPIEIRIGINTGFCTVGNFGSNQRLDYTAMGGQVNLASRLESLASPGSIVVSEETYILIKSLYKFQQPKRIDIKGFARTVTYFEMDVKSSAKMHFSNLNGTGYELIINEDLFTNESLKELKKSLSDYEV